MNRNKQTKVIKTPANHRTAGLAWMLRGPHVRHLSSRRCTNEKLANYLVSAPQPNCV